jgi:hypothetical protein
MKHSSRFLKVMQGLVLVLVLSTIWTFPSITRAQDSAKQTGWTSYTDMSHWVSDQAVDADGFLWFVGRGGAARWNTVDGTYTVYHTEEV